MIRVLPSLSVTTQEQINQVDVLKDFFADKLPSTILTYQRYLNEFMTFCGYHSVNEWLASIKPMSSPDFNAQLLRYKTSLIERKLSSNSINIKLATIRSIIKLTKTIGFSTIDVGIKNVKKKLVRDTKGVPMDDIKKMLDSQTEDSFEATRNRAMIRIMFNCAMRRSEISTIKLSDIDLDNNMVKISEKGGTTREMKIDSESVEDLRKWLKHRDDVGSVASDSDSLFLSKQGKPFSGQKLYYQIKKIAVQCELDPKKVRPHGFRHTAITQVVIDSAKDGLPLTDVKEFSRHKNLDCLTMYVDTDKETFNNMSTKLSLKLRSTVPDVRELKE